MINLILEFKTWLEAYEFRCKSKSKHYNRILLMIEKDAAFSKEFKKINKEIIENLKEYVVTLDLNSSNNTIYKDFADYVNNNLDGQFIPEIILKLITYKTAIGRDFKDMCEMEPIEVLNNIYVISSSMVKRKDILNQLLDKMLSTNFIGIKEKRPRDIFQSLISKFMINPNDLIKGYNPEFKELFKKEESPVNIDKGWEGIIGKEDSPEEIIKAQEDPFVKLHKEYLVELLAINISDVSSQLKNEINNAISNQCFIKNKIIEFHQYIKTKRTPEEYSSLKVCFYTKFMKDAFDKIISDALITPSDLIVYTNEFMNEFKKENSLETYEENIVKDVVDYFYESSYVVYSKFLKVLLGCKALEAVNLELKTTKKQICGFILIWIKNKFPNTKNLSDYDMNLVNNKMFNLVSKTITGKELTHYCYFGGEKTQGEI